MHGYEGGHGKLRCFLPLLFCLLCFLSHSSLCELQQHNFCSQISNYIYTHSLIPSRPPSLCIHNMYMYICTYVCIYATSPCIKISFLVCCASFDSTVHRFVCKIRLRSCSFSLYALFFVFPYIKKYKYMYVGT